MHSTQIWPSTYHDNEICVHLSEMKALILLQCNDWQYIVPSFATSSFHFLILLVKGGIQRGTITTRNTSSNKQTLLLSFRPFLYGLINS